MTILTVRPARLFALMALLLVLTACASTAPSPSTDDAQNAAEQFSFRQEDGKRITGAPARCGASIPAKQVATMSVGPGSEPIDAVRDPYPDAQLVRNNFVVTDIDGTPAKTKSALTAYFAGLGCDLLVFGDGPGSSATNDLRLIWGTQGQGNSELLIKNGFD